MTQPAIALPPALALPPAAAPILAELFAGYARVSVEGEFGGGRP